MVLKGKGAVPGIAVGSIFVYKKNGFIPAESFISASEVQSHLDHYQSVKEQAAVELEKIRLALKSDPEKAEIFRAHQDIVDDIVINEEIPDRITKEHWSGDWAIYQVYETCLAALRKVTDPLIAERASDIEDVRSLLLKLWHGKDDEGLSSLSEPVIIAAHELLPSDTASMDKDKVLAILSEKGGPASHSAIIAASYGIPAVLGIQGLLDNVRQGQYAAVDAVEGIVILDPDEEVISEYKSKNAAFRRGKQEDEKFLNSEGRTADGVKIDIGLNIANANEEELTAAAYTDSVGLFRTEFLFLGRDTLPTEDEQFAVYRKVLECFGKRPVILRTLDVGGDKAPPSVEFAEEANPFLGNRGIRFCFDHPDIFKTQIRAALRAGDYGNLWLMLPMVTSIEDIEKAREQIAAIGKELGKEPAKTGIMIEVPSIALLADKAAETSDFASIGSNDLCQYLCAADRMNDAVEPYYQSYHPAMFRLIKEIAASFEKAGKPVSICGELGADPLAVPVLIGLGLRKLSMGASSVAAVKRTIASVTVEECEKIAASVLQLSTAAEVREFLEKN